MTFLTVSVMHKASYCMLRRSCCFNDLQQSCYDISEQRHKDSNTFLIQHEGQKLPDDMIH